MCYIKLRLINPLINYMQTLDHPIILLLNFVFLSNWLNIKKACDVCDCEAPDFAFKNESVRFRAQA